MIEVVKGDLLKSDCTVIGHQANCFSTMGAGIARRIALIYPDAKRADLSFPGKPQERLGKCSYAVCEKMNGEMVVIFNLYGQFDYGRDPFKIYTNYTALRSALNNMLYTVEELQRRMVISTIKIGLPYGIGAGLANGDWKTIEKLIRDVSHYHNKTIYLYELE